MGAHDVDSALALLAPQGNAAFYLRNHVEDLRGAVLDAGRLYGVFAADGLQAVAFFGAGRQVTASECSAAAAEAIAALAVGEELGWRMFVGPPMVGAALRNCRWVARNLVLQRAQPVLAIEDRGRIPLHLLQGEPRLRFAVSEDLERLCDAALELSREDLGVDPTRVDRELLRAHVRERIRAGQCLVLGPAGDVRCKLDVAVSGRHGALIEGIYTLPSWRGRGLARRAVAGSLDRLLQSSPVVGLHLAADNAAARRAYGAAGMQQVATWQLLMLR